MEGLLMKRPRCECLSLRPAPPPAPPSSLHPPAAASTPSAPASQAEPQDAARGTGPSAVKDEGPTVGEGGRGAPASTSAGDAAAGGKLEGRMRRRWFKLQSPYLQYARMLPGAAGGGGVRWVARIPLRKVTRCWLEGGGGWGLEWRGGGVRFVAPGGDVEAGRWVEAVERERRALEGLPVLLGLDVVDGPFKGARFKIGSEGAVVMRNPKGISCHHLVNLHEIHLPDADVRGVSVGGGHSRQVSRRHAWIRFKDGAYVISDEGSLNGTLVNGRRLSAEKQKSEPIALQGGDVVEIGQSKFEVFFRVVVPEELQDAEERRQRQEEKRKMREIRRAERKRRVELQREVRLGSRNRAAAMGFLSSFGTAAIAASLTAAGDPGEIRRPNTQALEHILENVVSTNERLAADGDAAVPHSVGAWVAYSGSDMYGTRPTSSQNRSVSDAYAGVQGWDACPC